MTQVAFILFSLIVVLAAWRVAVSQNIMRSALALMVVLGGLAPLFVLLAAEFVATIQILVYVGAVVVMFLFAIMLTRAPMVPKSELSYSRKLPGMIIAIGIGAMLILSIRSAFGGTEVDPQLVGTADKVGEVLLREHVIAFETISVLLLAALIGAIVLARRD